jgi:hypothetical protein
MFLLACGVLFVTPESLLVVGGMRLLLMETLDGRMESNKSLTQFPVRCFCARARKATL